MNTISQILARIVELYSLVVLINVILSWFVHSTQNLALRRIYWTTASLVDPLLDPIRRIFSPMTRNIGIDFSPIILLLFLQVIEQMLR